jgi:protein-S-isoprenylcysteine O-methyltransferase Ste14
MIEPATLLLIVNLLYIGALPRIFFRKDGRFGPMWWATAAPFVVAAAFLLLRAGAPAAGWQLTAVPLSAASIALISLTLGTHPAPVSLWHQANDAPDALVTWGAYRRIRHPFYAAFLLALLATLLHAPHAVTLGTLAYGFAILNATAAREERRLLASPFGTAYRAYMQRTGRFAPKWSRHAA